MKGHEYSCPLGIFSRWPRCYKIAGIGIFVLASSVIENKILLYGTPQNEAADGRQIAMA